MGYYRIFSFFFSLIVVLGIGTSPLGAAEAAGPSLIRDAEVEAVLRDLSTPVFEAAGLHPQKIGRAHV